MSKATKRCIILSQGPVPTPEHTKVEGGGLRCWGLAKGLVANDPNLHVTIAYHESYKKKSAFTDKYQDVHVTTWNLENLPELVGQHDTIVVSYCMANLSIVATDSLQPNQQLVLDCYVPIYVEASARDTADLEAEYYAFHADVGRWAHVLRRGDVFLCASDAQKRYYTGVLSALGRINPATYGEDMILTVPYGIYRDEPKATSKPITALLKGKSSKKILWFGGIYPWFDLRMLVDAAKKLNEDIDATLVIVGAKNPFNTHPDFTRRYDELLEHIKTTEASHLVQLQDWVKFEDRANWYLDSDVVVVINQMGPENELAWRTRLVDFAWANLPIITNGGDPFGEVLLQANAAKRFSGLTENAIASDLLHLFNNPDALEVMKANLDGVRQELYWDVVTTRLTAAIADHARPGDFATFGFFEGVVGPGPRGTFGAISAKLRKLPGYVKRHGVRSTYVAARSVAGRRVKKYLPMKANGTPHVVIVSHQLDMSGAPFVIMEFAKELRSHYPKLPFEFYTFTPAHKDNIAWLNKAGIRPKILLNPNAVIDFRAGDVVVLNTSAQPAPLKEVIFAGLESGKLAKLFWYVHEDEPELIFSPSEARRIHSLMKAGKLEILTAATKTRENYQKHFKDTEHVNIQSYRLVIADKYHRTLAAKDFHDKLSFILPGTMGDGRKGQLPIFYAFAFFLRDFYQKNPGAYRDFELVFLGMSDDFMSRQILLHAKKALGEHLRTYGRTTREECLDAILQSNVTICYSMRECLPLFVFEGMITGHPVLRNDSSGMEEQLVESENGWRLDSKDFWQIVQTIETTLNREKTSDESLAHMSKASHKLAKKQEEHSYKPMIESVRRALS